MWPRWRPLPLMMRTVGSAVLLLLYVGVKVTSATAGRQSEEEKLLAYLFQKYNPSARPVINSTSTVTVKIQFSLMHIQELDVKSQILTATGLLILEWKDERLTWRPDDYSLNEIVVEAKNLWVPEFAVINGAEEIYADYREFRAFITSDGTVRWEPGGVFKTMCQIDITYFPFDAQQCALVFGAWSYHTTKMNLTNIATKINLDSYRHNGEWEIISTKVQRDEFFYDCCPKERFSNVAFNVRMRRRYTFYVMNVILPSMVTSILLLSIFYCPPAQKVQIGVVVLLSFRIFLLNVTDSIPKTSDHIPLLGIYLTCTMAITTLSMVLTVLVLNLHSISERPVPRCVRVIILKYMARLFCKCYEDEEHDLVSAFAMTRGMTPNNNRPKRRPGQAPNGSSKDDQVPIMMLNGINSRDKETTFANIRNELRNSRDATKLQKAKELREELNDLEFNPNLERPDAVSKEDKKSSKPDYSRDWHRVAEVVDRFFFWTFLLMILAITVLLFHPLHKEYFYVELEH